MGIGVHACSSPCTLTHFRTLFVWRFVEFGLLCIVLPLTRHIVDTTAGCIKRCNHSLTLTLQSEPFRAPDLTRLFVNQKQWCINSVHERADVDVLWHYMATQLALWWHHNGRYSCGQMFTDTHRKCRGNLGLLMIS